MKELPKVATRFAKYVFTTEEITDKGRELARLQDEFSAAEQEKTAAMAQFKQRMEATKLSIENISRQVNNGYEQRSVKHDVTYDFERGIKILKRQDGQGEPIEEAVEEYERQTHLDLEEEKKKNAAPEGKGSEETGEMTPEPTGD